MLKRRSPVVLLSAAMSLSALTLCAADVWVAKPYTAWSDKDIRKIMTDSPWSRSLPIVIPDGTVLRDFLARGPAPAPGGPGIAENGGGLGVGTSESSGPPPALPQGGSPGAPLIVRWQSAAVVQQALVKAQYGDKSATSPDAQKRLEPNGTYYIIAVSNLPASQKLRDEGARQALLGMTTLTVDGKDHPIVAKDVVYVGEGLVEARFLFPREFAITAGDKEVAFSTIFGKTAVKAKFNLKNMAINGKLGL